jgi:hypothetical protein
LAITLVGDGQTVGVATLGTALTDRQADLLQPHIREGNPGILVATDNDAAGDQTAERIFWQLTARGDDPRRLTQPDGLDPADVLHRDGAVALRTALETSDSLADAGRPLRGGRQRGGGDDALTYRGVLRGFRPEPLEPDRMLVRQPRLTQQLARGQRRSCCGVEIEEAEVWDE